MNQELNQKLNYLLLGEEKYTECPTHCDSYY